MTYENLLDEAEQNGLYVIENATFKSKSDGLINGDVIGINRKIHSYKKRSCILAEEIGHYHTATGDILDSASILNRKQEMRGRLWAYNRLIGLTGIVAAYQHGCQSIYEIADYLEVTEEFFLEALQQYKSKYGTHTQVDNYVIFFEPSLGVFELI